MSISGAHVTFDDVTEAARREDFPQLTGDDVIYLDNAGSSLHTKQQIRSFSNDIINNFYGNPHSSNHAPGARCGDVIEQVRLDVMRKFNVTSGDHVIFTSGATSACQLVAEVFDGNFVYLQDNHTSVVGMRESMASHFGSVYCLSTDRAKSVDPFCLDDYDVIEISRTPEGAKHRHLFAYPAQSNFSGAKYPLEWIGQVQNGNVKFTQKLTGGSNDDDEFYVFLDVASYVSTSPFNFAESRADFACLSFYKIFGFPTGLGILIVSERAAKLMTSQSARRYFGGGSVDAYLSNRDFHRPATTLHARYERGTINYYDIIALKHGFESLSRVAGSMRDIQLRTFRLTQTLYREMTALRHYNDTPLVVVYLHTEFESAERQGPIVTFNLCDSRSRFIGFNDVIRLATSHKIELRSGCFCNVGACVAMLGIDADVMEGIYQDGHRCGGERDVINGLPVGAVRASLGYFSMADDVTRFVAFLRDCFVEKEGKLLSSSETEELVAAEVGKVTIKKIVLFPVKSCRGMEVDEWVLRHEGGLEMDRKWMLVDEHGVCMTLKRHRKLARIQPHISGGSLRLSAQGHGSVTLDLAQLATGGQKQETREVKICGDRVLVYPCNDVTVDSWLSRVLECTSPIQLVQIHEDGGGDRCSLVNQAQYLAVTEPSLQALKDAMDDVTTDNDVMNNDEESLAARFRCNFVLGGASLRSFDEEKWTHLEIDDITGFDVTGNCRRCDVICVDPRDGSRRKEMLKILKSLPPVVGGSGEIRNSFGVYLRLSSESDIRLKIGSEVAVVL